MGHKAWKESYEEAGGAGAAPGQALLLGHGLVHVADGALDAQHREAHDLGLQRHVQLHLLL